VTGAPEANAEVDILEVEEKTFVQPADVVSSASSNQHAGAKDPIDLPRAGFCVLTWPKVF
jgi:hypothetical protein